MCCFLWRSVQIRGHVCANSAVTFRPNLRSGFRPICGQVFAQSAVRFLPNLRSGFRPICGHGFAQSAVMFLPNLRSCFRPICGHVFAQSAVTFLHNLRSRFGTICGHVAYAIVAELLCFVVFVHHGGCAIIIGSSFLRSVFRPFLQLDYRAFCGHVFAQSAITFWPNLRSRFGQICGHVFAQSAVMFSANMRSVFLQICGQCFDENCELWWQIGCAICANPCAIMCKFLCRCVQIHLPFMWKSAVTFWPDLRSLFCAICGHGPPSPLASARGWRIPGAFFLLLYVAHFSECKRTLVKLQCGIKKKQV